MGTRISNTVAVDDGPFERDGQDAVAIAGAVFTQTRFDGVITGHITRDGDDASIRIAEMLTSSPFHDHVQLLWLGGITVGGFNVVDVAALSEAIERPVVTVARKPPDMASIEAALRGPVPGGELKWRRLLAAGPMEPCGGLWVQRSGIELAPVREAMARLTVHGALPEPLRVAHLLAGGLARGVSRGRA
jgi:endonuclease V-like protein UPF0215 family